MCVYVCNFAPLNHPIMAELTLKQKKDFASKEGDTLMKITAAIRNLETETNTAEKMATGKEFLAFVRKTCGLEKSKEIARLFNAYIKTCF